NLLESPGILQDEGRSRVIPTNGHCLRRLIREAHRIPVLRARHKDLQRQALISISRGQLTFATVDNIGFDLALGVEDLLTCKPYTANAVKPKPTQYLQFAVVTAS